MKIAQLLVAAAAFNALAITSQDATDPRTRTFVMPKRIMWVSQNNSSSKVENAQSLLKPKFGQVPEGKWMRGDGCFLVNSGATASILLDFGRELHGGLQFAVGTDGKSSTATKIRVRTGESASEAMAELGEKGACNDHAIRDGVIELPWFGTRTIGDTGFRFARIDLVTEGAVNFQSIRAVSLMRPLERLGSFKCSDERLNAIWQTAADTLHLCCQDYIWDGIKRDRLVWQGDMHPEVISFLHVFGPRQGDVVKASLDFMRDNTPADSWMNGMPAYTLWWIRCQHDWWFHSGDTAYLRTQLPYLQDTFKNLAKQIGPLGECKMNGFLDWPTQHNKDAVAAGMQALMLMAFNDGADLAAVLGDEALADLCRDCAKRVSAVHPDWAGGKAAAALLGLAGLDDIKNAAAHIAQGGERGISTFYGFYMLDAQARGGDPIGAISTLRNYWGGMLDMGATSFWEDFNLAWTNNAYRIDELPVSGKKDIHGDYGEFCYKGFRHSLCHGWSSGPASLLPSIVLGIRVVAPACARILCKPELGDLQWAEADFPTSAGVVHIRAERTPSGKPKVIYTAPANIEVEVVK